MTAALKIDRGARANLRVEGDLRWSVSRHGSLVLKGVDATLTIAAHPHGLIVTKHGRDRDVDILPGEVRFDRLVAYLAAETGIPIHRQPASKEKVFASSEAFGEHAWREQRLKIATALRQSGVWSRRGMSDQKKEAPKEFWSQLSIAELLTTEAHRGPRHVWQRLLESVNPTYFEKSHAGRLTSVHEQPNTILRRAQMTKAMELRLLPETPWTIRKWNKVPLTHLARYAVAGITRMEKWGYFATNGLMFENLIAGHGIFDYPVRIGSPMEELRAKFLAFLEHWPKTKAGVDSLNEAYNQGMTTHAVLAIAPQSPKELRELTQAWRQAREHGRKHLNETYKPPDLELKSGWKYVDHTNAHLMSDLYSCCFSNSPTYINQICRGDAFAVYRPSIHGTDKGALAFFRREAAFPRGSRGAEHSDIEARAHLWKLAEIKAFGNDEPNAAYRRDMEVLARTMNATRPGAMPEVIQDTDRRLRAMEALNPKLGITIRLARSVGNQVLDRAESLCAAHTLPELLASAGHVLDKDEYVWRASTERELEKERERNAQAALVLGIPETGVTVEKTEIERECEEAMVEHAIPF